ncbi:hypothetical protein XELAEV_18010736mg [Xenopus laevis]|uniref:Uncharacterized protein n=1 Tax=Xenopus laevis TaxID=8355 RepID=A0A974DV37_XENLA|nr:hypothetical protein XELAEV_18010736mg [Xenopus laevis]
MTLFIQFMACGARGQHTQYPIDPVIQKFGFLVQAKVRLPSVTALGSFQSWKTYQGHCPALLFILLSPFGIFIPSSAADMQDVSRHMLCKRIIPLIDSAVNPSFKPCEYAIGEI